MKTLKPWGEAMKEKEKEKPVYEPPLARDLSEECAAGADLITACTVGPAPTAGCQFGSAFGSSGCSFGNKPSGCAGGSMPDSPFCRTGSSAISGCITGGDA